MKNVLHPETINPKISGYSREQLNTCDLMKCLALALMFIDHAGFYFFTKYELLRAIGRISAPIWLFFVGYFYHHRDTKKIYALAFIDYPLQNIFLAFYGASAGFNILMTIIISRMIVKKIMHYSSELWLLLSSVLLLIFLTPITAPMIEYGTIMTLFALVGALKKEKHPYADFVLVVALIAYGIVEQLLFNFSIQNQLVLVFGLMQLFFVLKEYSLKTVEHSSKVLSRIAMWLSHHSLIIYFIHINLFRVTSLVIAYSIN